jgi:hypothetical protein
MKDTQRCPKCERQGRSATNVVYVAAPDDATYGGYAPEALAHKGWLGGGDRRGLLEAYVCNDCGYVEFYIKDAPMPPSHSQEVGR